MISRFAVVVLAVLLTGAMPAVRAATYFVSPAGSNWSDGSQAKPWRTLQHAADRVKAGDIVLVADGSYSPFFVAQSGTAKAPITFKAVNARAATIQGSNNYDGRLASVHVTGSYIVIDGFQALPTGTNTSERGIRVSGSSSSPVYGVVVRNCLVHGAGWSGITASFAYDLLIEENDVSGSRRQHGIYLANSGDNPVVRRNVVHDNPYAGLQMNGDRHSGGDGIISKALVENNIFYQNGSVSSAAINMDGVTHSVIRNNLLFNNHRQGITNFRADGGSASINNRILNNTIIMPAGASHGMSFRKGSTGGYVRNNIILHLGGADSMAVDAASLPGFDSDYNVLTRLEDTDGMVVSLATWRSRHPGLDKHSVQAGIEQLFVNPVTEFAAADYRLKTGSPAIDSGMVLPDVTHDLDGKPRPAGSGYDRGAFEANGLATAGSPDASRH